MDKELTKTKHTGKKSTAHWVHIPSLERQEPATEINEQAIVEFRNGLAKFWKLKGIEKTMVGTIAYRSMLDLDHLARLLHGRGTTSTMTVSYVIKPKHKKDIKRFMAVAKKMRANKRKWSKA